MKKLLYFLLLFTTTLHAATIIPGADRYSLYLPYLKNKNIAVFANQTSRVGNQSLIDFLLSKKIRVIKIFSPEHGFRGTEDAGNHINNLLDKKTGIPIISLYGKKFKPSSEDLANIDVIVFDIQDVGVRFYTYISSLQKIMEAAIENNKSLIILDRPNPNGFYVDGPVLNPKFKSFTGMQPIPIVYGMTIGEYAKMLVGEEWLSVNPKGRAHDLKLRIIPIKNYTHNSYYIPPIKPSPNLPDIKSIYLYPSIGLMEATAISVGRGTKIPFQVYGHPKIHASYKFIPRAMPGAMDPPYKNKICYGWHIKGSAHTVRNNLHRKLQIKYILNAYHAYPDKKYFFGHLVSKTSGMPTFASLVVSGANENAIRASWEPALSNFKKIRKKYLLYKDFNR